MDLSTIYNFSFKKLNSDEQVALSQFKGKKLMIVNVASECGNTKQYAALQELHEKFGDKIAILGFPCNDFGGQEPASEGEIAAFCDLNYKVTFPMFEKLSVLGENAHPMYRFLADKVGSPVEWNFGKYFIDVEEDRINYFLASSSPLDDVILNSLGVEI